MDIDVLKGRITAAARNAVRLDPKPAGAPLGAGETKFGGRPDLPYGFEWPRFACEDGETRPLAFLAQINLADVSAHGAGGLLPETGLLSFFYETETQPWGFTPDDAGSARVYWFDCAGTLVPTDVPEGAEMLPERGAELCGELTVPAYEELDSECGYEEYCEAVSLLGFDPDAEPAYARLLGWPELIQGPMEEECERVSRGRDCGTPEGYADGSGAESADIAAKAREWRLLFCMGSDDDGAMFGDCVNIYFWMRESDLRERRFEKAHLILQCA